MRIEVSAGKRLGQFELEVALDIDDRIVAVVGPSGAGKTTLLNLVAGLLRPDAGRIAVGGATLVDTVRGIWVPPHRRRLGYVFQDGRLLPHLSVRQNLLYGRWFMGRDAARESLAHIVELLGLGHLLERWPSRLSGGEKQRVAIGRALLSDPRLLLMDEPLSSLDAMRKAEILPYFERLRDETRVPIVYVSHSAPEVERLASTFVVLEGGRVRFVGNAAEALSHLKPTAPV